MVARYRLNNLPERVTRIKPRISPVRDDAIQVCRIKGRQLQRIRTTLLEANALCAECEKRGIVRLGTEVDHIIALAIGGRDTLNPFENRQLLCKDCHADKTRLDIAQAAARRARA